MSNQQLPIYVLDNTVLTNFSRIERLDLLRRFLGKLYITREVEQEMEAGIVGSVRKNPSLSRRLSGTRALIQSGSITVQSPSSLDGLVLYAELQAGGALGKGEISSMVLARERNGIFITDDEKAWKEAKRRNIQVLGADYLGTKWMLLTLLESGDITQGELESLRELLLANKYIFSF